MNTIDVCLRHFHRLSNVNEPLTLSFDRRECLIRRREKKRFLRNVVTPFRQINASPTNRCFSMLGIVVVLSRTRALSKTENCEIFEQTKKAFAIFARASLSADSVRESTKQTGKVDLKKLINLSSDFAKEFHFRRVQSVERPSFIRGILGGRKRALEIILNYREIMLEPF